MHFWHWSFCYGILQCKKSQYLHCLFSFSCRIFFSEIYTRIFIGIQFRRLHTQHMHNINNTQPGRGNDFKYRRIFFCRSFYSASLHRTFPLLFAPYAISLFDSQFFFVSIFHFKSVELSLFSWKLFKQTITNRTAKRPVCWNYNNSPKWEENNTNKKKWNKNKSLNPVNKLQIKRMPYFFLLSALGDEVFV